MLRNVLHFIQMRLAASDPLLKCLFFLFDFLAAFPNLQWNYLFALFKVMGTPAVILGAISCVFGGRGVPSGHRDSGHEDRISCFWKRFRDNDRTVFAMLVVPKLSKVIDVHCYADDVGCILYKFEEHTKKLAASFKVFGEIPDLWFGVKHCIIILLFQIGGDGLRAMINRGVLDRVVMVRMASAYLGN